MTTPVDPERLARLLRRIEALAPAAGPAPEADDDPLAAAEAAVAAAEAELAEQAAHRRRVDEQMAALFETITAFAALDYHRQAPVREDCDDITNAMAVGLNMMGEELSHTMSALVDARDVALAASRTKSAFLANISHELRTPLNAIIGYAELIHEVLEETGQAALLLDLQRLMIASRHLLMLIQDVLDLSRIEAGRLDVRPEAVDLRRLLRELESTIAPSVAAAGNRLEILVDLPRPVIWTDPLRAQQIFLNILGNANKFTQGGDIRLTAREASDRRDRWVVVDIADTGVGIPADKLEAVFEAFTQADNEATRRFGGTGLGLTISRRLCEMLGGSISVISEPGRGSTFTVRLPLRQPPAPR